MTQTRVVIVGGGFGGFSVARRLLRSSVSHRVAITILDPSSASVYTPWLYEVASGGLLEDSLRGDLVRATDIMIDQFSGIRFRKSALQSVDPIVRNVVCTDGSAIPYDICVIAVGSVSNDFGISGAKQFATDLKRTSDALMIRTELSNIMQSASVKQQRIVIAGAGANGTEFAAECAATVRALEKRGALNPRSVEVMLIDSGDEPLKMLSPFLRKKTQARLRDLGVVLRMNTALVNVAEHSVGLKHIVKGIPSEKIETVSCDYCITALGVQMPEIVASLPFEKHPKGRIFVDDALRTLEYRDIFVLGDAAFVKEGKFPDPQTAQVAVEQSMTVAKNIVAMITKRPVSMYRQHKTWDILIALGGKFAVGRALGVPIWGYTAYILRRFVDARYFFSVLPWRNAFVRVVKGVAVYGKNETP
ncbi:MAG: FAD-dependent oxidoreductase [Patescibacteria group bacterium]